MTDAVLFDLDLTLCEHDQDGDELLARAFDRVGVEQYCTEADLAAVVDDLPRADSDLEFYRLSFEAAARRADADPSYTTTLARAYDDLIDHSAVSFLPGAEAALDAARAAGKVGLVTNGGPETQSEKLAALGIEDAFEATVFCHGIDPKPDPVPFEQALSALEAAAERSLVVGDSLAADVGGANAMGMTSVWVPRGDRPEDPDPAPDHTLDSLAELKTVL